MRLKNFIGMETVFNTPNLSQKRFSLNENYVGFHNLFNQNALFHPKFARLIKFER